MDCYLRCIYNKIMECGFTEKYKTLIEYRGCLARRNTAWEKLEALLDDYETEQRAIDSITAEALFEEAVAVGKYMAR